MRSPLPLLLLSAAVGFAQPPAPPGTIVFEPKKPAPSEPAKSGSISVLKGSDPKFPGFIVFSPNKAEASKLLPLPSPKVDSPDGIPTITIIGTGAKKDPPPPADPKPAPGGTKPPPPPEPVEDGKLLVDTYDVAYCRGCKVGYLHTVVREFEKNGKKLLYGTKRFTLQMARFGQVIEQWTEDSTIETSDGTILRTAFRQGGVKNQTLELTGEVKGKELEVAITGTAVKNGKDTIPWPDGVAGIARETTMLREMKPKAGTAVEFKAYMGQFNGIITYKFNVKGAEEVDDGGKKRKLLKVIQEMVPVGDFKLPPTTFWLDPDTYEPAQMEVDFAAIGGLMTAKRTTREVALAKPTKYLDLGEMQSIKLPTTIAGIHEKDTLTYRVTLSGDIPPTKAFPSDARQTVTVTDEKARTLDIMVTAVRTPTKPKLPPAAPDKEYLSDSYYIDWDNDLVKGHAATATKGLPKSASDWEKAQAVEKWVKANMKAMTFDQVLATCKQTAKDLGGDCTEYAMLACGMCRSLGVPSRTAIGLVYAPTKDGGAQLAYHMWAEVWADGGWVALDPTLGKGSVGPGHIKVTDAHWDGVKDFKPLLPVMTLLGSRPVVTVK